MSNKKNSRFYNKPPSNYKDFFDKSSDKEFYEKYKFLYVVFVIFGLAILMTPTMIFISIAPESKNDTLAAFFGIIGLVGSMAMGIGIVNVYAAIIRQYLGHIVTLISLGGGLLVTILSYIMLSIV